MLDTIKSGILYLVPSAIAQAPVNFFLPKHVIEIIHSLDEWIVENSKSARQFLKSCETPIPQPQLLLHELDKHEGNIFKDYFFENLLKGKNIGLLSDAGCPAIADPGAAIVAQAHQLQIKVTPLTGPSSLLLALMASGLNGQQFTFNGYLPKEKNERIAAIKKLEQLSIQKKQTQIVIETPYRNNNLFDDFTRNLQHQTKLCIAADIQSSTEMIITKKISEWKKHQPDLNKRQVVWLFLA